jgi:hypothetical protein
MKVIEQSRTNTALIKYRNHFPESLSLSIVKHHVRSTNIIKKASNPHLRNRNLPRLTIYCVFMKNRLIIFAFVLIQCCSTVSSFAQQRSSHLPKPSDVTLYQINIRAFSKEGNLRGIIPRLDSIKSLGINVIYLMPIYPVGKLNAVNSPYCVRDYKAVNEEFGSMQVRNFGLGSQPYLL